MRGALLHSFNILPQVWKRSWESLMSSEHAVASAATLSRARLTVDISYMVYWQQKYDATLAEQNPPVFYLLVDSSPQGSTGLKGAGGTDRKRGSRRGLSRGLKFDPNHFA